MTNFSLNFYLFLLCYFILKKYIGSTHQALHKNKKHKICSWYPFLFPNVPHFSYLDQQAMIASHIPYFFAHTPSLFHLGKKIGFTSHTLCIPQHPISSLQPTYYDCFSHPLHSSRTPYFFTWTNRPKTFSHTPLFYFLHPHTPLQQNLSYTQSHDIFRSRI